MNLPSKKKIVCHISYHNALDDRIYWKELVALKEGGYEAVHICVSDKDNEYITAEGIKIIEVKSQKTVSNIWMNRIAQLFFKKHSAIQIVLKKAAQVSADVYHYHDLQINTIAKHLKKLAQRPKVIYDVHEVWHVVVKEQRKKGFVSALQSYGISTAIKFWELRNAAYCDYIIATDQFTLDYFNKYLPSIPKGIVFNYSFFPPQLNISKAKQYHFIYTGLLGSGRGMIEIVQAISVLSKKIPDVKVLLIGPFENENFETLLRIQIAKLELNRHIEIKEPVPFTEIQFYYEVSCIGLGLLQTTPKYATSIPIKLFEYMAFGLPVIFSNHGISADIIKETNCGLLVDVNNIDEIANAMMKLLSNNSLYNALGRNGIKAVATTYNWKSEKSKLLQLYQSIINTP